MIGVIPKPGQLPAVEEFFQLFKTSWELYRPGRRYDVVVATSNDVPPVDTRLLILFGSETTTRDRRDGVAVRSRCPGALVSYREAVLPIYGALVTFEDRAAATPCLITNAESAGLLMDRAGARVIRVGYDLFSEVAFLLSSGQPVAHAHLPTLDLHVLMLREWILGSGIALIEIPPVSPGYRFAVCLTHDIDFIGIRQHRFDHTMLGFLYRSTIGGVRDLLRRRISIGRLLKMWRAVASLPFVFVGLARDFWEPFEWYLRVEKGLPATYYLIPFKRRQGQNVPGRDAAWRATAYDVDDLSKWTARLTDAGCELGVHGIDAWHSVDKGREELARLAAVTAGACTGIRMHWLLRDANSAPVLEQAGYGYDSSVGYNETVGYRSGTAQAFRPLGVERLLELPLHIQDGALFYANRLDLSEVEAWKRCGHLMRNADAYGGVLTVLWHDRSHGPERFWGDFYVRLVEALKSSKSWFGTAAQVVGWFSKRRAVRFESLDSSDSARLSLRYDGEEIHPPLTVRVHRPSGAPVNGAGNHMAASTFVDIPWNGKTPIALDSNHEIPSAVPTFPTPQLYSLS